MFRPLRWRVLMVAAFLPAALATAPASAAVSSSSITAPTSGLITEFNGDLTPPTPETAPANVSTVTGATDGGSTNADTVDIGCQYSKAGSPTWRVLADNVPVTGHAFTTTILKSAGENYPCVVRAIPGNTPDGNRATLPVAAFTGPQVFGGDVESYTHVSGTNAGLLRDFYDERSQPRGFFDYDSAPSCGLDYSAVFTGSIKSQYMFDCNDYFSYDYNSTRNGVQVDGKSAYLPSDLENTTKTGAPVLAFSHTVDPVTGDVTINESDPAVVCVPAGADLCTSYASSGLRLDRTIRQNHAGLQTTISDEWVSTDGQAHKLDLIEEEDLAGDAANIAFKASWEDAAYTPRSKDDLISGLPVGTPGTLYIDNDKAVADADPVAVQGAITYASAPSGFRFGGGDSLYARYLKTVPAGGRTNITQVYSQSAVQAEVVGLAKQAEQLLTPPPAPPAPPAPVPPAPAPVTVTKTVTVQVPAPQCVIPKLSKLSLTKAKAALKKAKCRTGRVTRRTTHARSRVGRVIRVSKQAGAGWPVGTRVNLVVGKKAHKRKAHKRKAKRATKK